MGEQNTRANHDGYEKHPDCHALSHRDPSKTFGQDFQFSKQYARAYSGRLKCVKDYGMLGTLAELPQFKHFTGEELQVKSLADSEENSLS
jgi:hypothetical protein